MIRKNCFAYLRETNECNALTELDCTFCRFYKPRKEVKNNVFYKWSFKNEEEYQEAMQKLILRAIRSDKNGKVRNY